MASGIFMIVDLRHRKRAAPKFLDILEGSGTDLVEHAGLDADVDEAYAAAVKPSRQQQMSWFAAEERDCLRRTDRDAHHLARAAVDPAGQVDAEHGRWAG